LARTEEKRACHVDEDMRGHSGKHIFLYKDSLSMQHAIGALLYQLGQVGYRTAALVNAASTLKTTAELHVEHSVINLAKPDKQTVEL